MTAPWDPKFYRAKWAKAIAAVSSRLTTGIGLIKERKAQVEEADHNRMLYAAECEKSRLTYA